MSCASVYRSKRGSRKLTTAYSLTVYWYGCGSSPWWIVTWAVGYYERAKMKMSSVEYGGDGCVDLIFLLACGSDALALWIRNAMDKPSQLCPEPLYCYIENSIILTMRRK